MTALSVYKYEIGVDDTVTLELPAGARVLSVQEQGPGKTFLWALVNIEEKQMERRDFAFIGTGHVHPAEEFQELRYINTFQMLRGALVWHVFEIGEEDIRRRGKLAEPEKQDD